tara:strand:- start:39 stop:269 length:231 start_codon:yes stop_codon:yes gene_type:complete
MGVDKFFVGLINSSIKESIKKNVTTAPSKIDPIDFTSAIVILPNGPGMALNFCFYSWDFFNKEVATSWGEVWVVSK